LYVSWLLYVLHNSYMSAGVFHVVVAQLINTSTLYVSWLLYVLHNSYMSAGVFHVVVAQLIYTLTLYVSWLLYVLHHSNIRCWICRRCAQTCRCCMTHIYSMRVIHVSCWCCMTHTSFIFVLTFHDSSIVYTCWGFMTHIFLWVGVACWCCMTHIYFKCDINASWIVYTSYMLGFDDSYMLYIRFWWLIFTL